MSGDEERAALVACLRRHDESVLDPDNPKCRCEHEMAAALARLDGGTDG